MKVLVIGSGGREDAIARKILESPLCDKIYVLPGNGGTASYAVNVPIGVMETDKICDFAKSEKIDFVVVAPDDPLVAGTVDALHSVGVECFGPEAKAAVIEGSKVFSKNLMKKYDIPTADYQVFTNSNEALEYIKNGDFPVVIKADGLALGKGVIIAEDYSEAEKAVISIMEDMRFGESGRQIVCEEFLCGPEVSVLCFTDGKTIVPMVSSMDHKRAYDNDEGPNTGGMGAIAPNPFYTKEIADICMDKIFRKTVDAMNLEGRTFRGCLYFGLMLTKKGPCVIEYNCRFGDPETQVVLPLLESDLLKIMLATKRGELDKLNIKFSDKSACCVITASGGYPDKYDKGKKITIPMVKRIYHAGTTLSNGDLVTSGGRVLGVTATGKTLKEAISKSYEIINEIEFDGMFYRKDIGKKALKELG